MNNNRQDKQISSSKTLGWRGFFDPDLDVQGELGWTHGLAPCADMSVEDEYPCHRHVFVHVFSKILVALVEGCSVIVHAMVSRIGAICYLKFVRMDVVCWAVLGCLVLGLCGLGSCLRRLLGCSSLGAAELVLVFGLGCLLNPLA